MDSKIQEISGHLAHCRTACNYCFDACLHEKDVRMMARCIKLDKECAEICGMTLSLVASGSGFSGTALRLCIEACEQCAAECEKFPHDHCKECAKVCRECAQACRAYA